MIWSNCFSRFFSTFKGMYLLSLSTYRISLSTYRLCSSVWVYCVIGEKLFLNSGSESFTMGLRWVSFSLEEVKFIEDYKISFISSGYSQNFCWYSFWYFSFAISGLSRFRRAMDSYNDSALILCIWRSFNSERVSGIVFYFLFSSSLRVGCLTYFLTTLDGDNLLLKGSSDISILDLL